MNFKHTFLFVFLFSLSFLFAKESIQVTTDTSSIRIGEQIKLDITIEGEEGVDYLFPTNKDTLTDKLEIIQKSTTDTLEKDEQMVYHQQWLLTSFDSGLYKVAPLEFIVIKDSVNIDTFKSTSFQIKVGTVVLDTTDTIKTINDIYDAPSRPINWLLYGGILVAVLMIAGIVYFVVRQVQKRNKKEKVIQKPTIPAHIIASNSLKQLEAKQLWQAGKEKEYHSELTEIIRVYLEQRFAIYALEKTSDEVLYLVQNSYLLQPKEFESLRAIFKLSDMVKFAKKKCLPDENTRSMDMAKTIVENTKEVSFDTTNQTLQN